MAYKMAYLHMKRINFIQKGQNESKFHCADKKNEYFHAKIPQKKNFILLILDGVLRVIFDSTYLENRLPLGFQNFEIEIESFFITPPPH